MLICFEAIMEKYLEKLYTPGRLKRINFLIKLHLFTKELKSLFPSAYFENCLEYWVMWQIINQNFEKNVLFKWCMACLHQIVTGWLFIIYSSQ